MITDEDAGDEITSGRGARRHADGSRCGRRGRARRRRRSRPPRSRGVLLRRRAGRLAAGSTLAYARLDRAASLNPLSAEPFVLQGSMALQIGDSDLARRAFERALDREPQNWYAYLQLAMLEGSLGNTAAARAQPRSVARPQPERQGRRQVRRLLDEGREIDPNELNARFFGSSLPGFQGLYVRYPVVLGSS